MTEISRTVSTALQSLRQREQTSRLAAEISDVSKEVTTGLKANPYDDLGHRSADAIAIRMQITRNDGFLTSNALLDRRFLAVETSTMFRAHVIFSSLSWIGEWVQVVGGRLPH